MKLKIYPSIGIARIGESDDFYYGPETYCGLPIEEDGTEFSTFRDARGKLRKQAARFQVYWTDDETSDALNWPVVPGRDGVSHIEWVVWLANKKAVWYTFEQLKGEGGYAADHERRNASLPEAQIIIDPGPQSVVARATAAVAEAEFSQGKGRPGYAQSFPPADLTPYAITSLGKIRTDATGLLTVLGGSGCSGAISGHPVSHYANNPGWFDDIADGPVTAVVVMANGERREVDASAWVMVGPPSYAPQIPNTVTLYDTLYDLFVRKFNYAPDIFANGAFNQAYKPNFARDIEPLLRRPEINDWVIGNLGLHKSETFNWTAFGNPDPAHNKARQHLFVSLRTATHDDTISTMPKLAGDNPFSLSKPMPLLTLSPTTMFLLAQWGQGLFTTETLPAANSNGHGAARDLGILSNCVGGAFCPGIEISWNCRDARVYSAPFRVRHKWRADAMLGGAVHLSRDEDMARGMEPGDLTKRMAQPWQADFLECTQQDAAGLDAFWWPAQRPITVMTEQDTKAWTREVINGVNNGEIKHENYLRMIMNWSALGFIRQQEDGRYLEVERNFITDGVPSV